MKRDQKGRFRKENNNDDKGFKLSLTLPSFNHPIYWPFLFIIIMPWAIILERRNALKKIFDFFDYILTLKEEFDTPKKNGIFY